MIIAFREYQLVVDPFEFSFIVKNLQTIKTIFLNNFFVKLSYIKVMIFNIYVVKINIGY